jgi:hypothetical protein
MLKSLINKSHESLRYETTPWIRMEQKREELQRARKIAEIMYGNK